MKKFNYGGIKKALISAIAFILSIIKKD